MIVRHEVFHMQDIILLSRPSARDYHRRFLFYFVNRSDTGKKTRGEAQTSGDTQLIQLPVEDHWQDSYHVLHVYYVGGLIYVAEAKYTHMCVWDNT